MHETGTRLGCAAIAALLAAACQTEAPDEVTGEPLVTGTLAASWAPPSRAGSNTTAPVTLSNGTSQPGHALVEARAIFGGLTHELYNASVALPPNAQQIVELDLAAAAALHPRQHDFATLLRVDVTYVIGDDQRGLAEPLPARYLIHTATGLQLLDQADLDAHYPGGATSATAAQEIALAGQHTPDDGIDLGVGPGTYREEPPKTEAIVVGGLTTYRLCFKYNVDYLDRYAGDYWYTTSAKKAHGVRVRVTDNTTGMDNYYGHANPSTGCVTALLSRSRSYRVRMYSQAQVSNGNRIYVWNNPTNKRRYYRTVAAAFSPSFGGSYTFTWTNGSNNAVNIVAAASLSLYRRYGGTSDEIYVLYNQDCPGSSGSCRRTEDDLFGHDEYSTVYIGSGLDGNRRKFIISHELGHAVSAMFTDNKKPPNRRSTSYSSDSCGWNASGNSHSFASEEWQSGALYEGFAQYYAATVWNDTREKNCEFYYYKDVDFSPRDGTDEPRYDAAYHSTIYSCESGGDFIATCYAESGTPHTAATSTEADWMRFFWDLQTDEGLSFGFIANIWRDAGPDTWTDSNVYSRLRTAAANKGVSLSRWDMWARYNGVDH